jgi:preprotein translocase subunit SecD
MNRSLLWRGLLILGLVAISLFSMLPLGEKLKLGLDLRGGMHLVLQVKTEDALRAETDQDMERLRLELGKKGASPTTERTGDSAFTVTGVPVASDGDVTQVASDYLPGWDWRRDGERLLFTMTAQNESAIRDQAANQAMQTIRNRVDEFGVGENQVARQGMGSDRIVAQLPGVDDPERIKRNIKNTAFLEFRLVDYPPPPADGAPSEEAVLANYGGALPSHLEILPRDVRDRQGRVARQVFYAVEKTRVITGRDLKTARPGLGEFNQPIVNFQLSAEGGRAFGRATGDNVGRGLAIVLDGKVVSAPRINSRISDAGLIEGGFTQAEVEDLSAVLRSGALPAGITYLEERTVGPSLGADSIRAGLKAGAIAAALTVLSMFLVYRFTGLNAVAALILNVVLVFGALAYFNATLTLPGIAGIILTIGMAFDANVLVFERIREELRLGKSVKAAVEAGFTKAMSSIVDSNITTLIAALFLFQFGTGPVRGFAVTLSIGILATLIAGVFFSRWLFGVTVLRRERVERLSI